MPQNEHISTSENIRLRTKLHRLLTQLPYLPRTCRLIWRAARPWTVAWLCIILLQGLLPVATVYLTRALVDSLSLAFRQTGNEQALRQAMLWVALFALVLLLNEALSGLAAWVRTAQAEAVQDQISALIHSKAIQLEMAFFDKTDSYDRLHRAQVDALYRPMALLENMGALAQHGLTFAAMAGVLLAFGWWAPVVLLVGVLPALGVVLAATLKEFQWWKATTPQHRRANYYNWVLTDRETAAEVRIFGLGAYFQQAYQTLRAELRQGQVGLARQQAIAQFSAGMIALVTSALVLAWMIRQTFLGALTLGGLAMFYQAFTQGQQLMRTLLGSVTQVYSNILFLENLFEFLALEPQLREPAMPTAFPCPLQQGIHFDNVTFRYPDSEQLALDGFSLYIPAGQIVAIVGENGAGKSTLIKLLCRFYDPDAGRVTIDGIPVCQFSQATLWRQITVLFQQPVHYHTTAAQNIALSDWQTSPTQATIESAADAAGAAPLIAHLPQGYETVLGKWFGGAELSGGEWQRVALARAFLRQAPIIVLDEPTSALDSWAEADWMQRFRCLAAGRTALIITHRFTTAMRADIIHVMAEGKIVESGSHSDLLRQGSRYAWSWQAQMDEQKESI